MTNRQNSVIQSRLLGRYFLEVKQACYFKEKQLVVFVANDKIQDSKQKTKFWESCICYHELDNSQCLHFFFLCMPIAVYVYLPVFLPDSYQYELFSQWIRICYILNLMFLQS